MSRTQMASLARAQKHHQRIPDAHCPACGAKPGEFCINKYGKQSRYAHSVRGRQSLSESGLPDLRAWWRSMRVYEPSGGMKRPPDLVVP